MLQSDGSMMRFRKMHEGYDPTDRRAKLVTTTARGRAAERVARDAIADMRDEKKFIVEYVAKAQANEKALKELLQKLQKIEEDRLKAAAKS